MKKLLHFFLLPLLAIVVFTGCSKDDEAEPVTAMEMTVRDNLGNIVSGATVKLYTSQTDWENQENQFGTTQTTDEKGQVTFKDLDAIKYYWYVEKDCMNNYNGANTTSSAMQAKKVNTTTAILSSTGDITLTNNSSNPYKIYIDGEYVFTAEGNTSYTYTDAPTESYTIRVVQESGYAVYPTDKSYTAPVTCGKTTTVVFPNN